MRSFYVSPQGDDTGAGTLRRPFATLARARDAIRALDELPEDGVTVWVRGGVFEFTETLALDARDSGTESAPIVYRAYAGEEVRLRGGVEILPSAFRPVEDASVLARLDPAATGQVLVADLAALGISDYGMMQAHGFGRSIDPAPLELFFSDEPLTLARWPNEGRVPIERVIDTGSIPRNSDSGGRGGVYTFSYDRAARWSQAEDLWVGGTFSYGYADDHLPVAEIDLERKTITLGTAHMYGLMADKDWRAYYVYNLLEELNQPGEWYLDRTNGKLYLWPPAPIADASIVVSMLREPLVALENVSWVTLQGLTFEASRGMGVYIEGGEHNRVAGCTLRNLGTVAVSMGQGIVAPGDLQHEFTGQPASRVIGGIQGHLYSNTAWNRNAGLNQGVIGCDIYNTGAGGILLGGGDRKSLTVGGNYAQNNHIHHYSRRDLTYRPAVSVDGVGNRIAHNLIHDAPHQAIALHGNDHLIEFNEVHHVTLEADDMGAFYMGRDPSERGNVIRYNYWHDIGSDWSESTNAVYFDDGACGTEVYGNLFVRAGRARMGAVFIHGGNVARVENNVFVDCPLAVGLTRWNNARWDEMRAGALWQERLLAAVDITTPPYVTRYPELATFMNEEQPTRGIVIARNLLVDVTRLTRGDKIGFAIDDNYGTRTDPGFVGREVGDYALRDDSVVWQELEGFEPLPLDLMGLMIDEYRPELPVDVKDE